MGGSSGSTCAAFKCTAPGTVASSAKCGSGGCDAKTCCIEAKAKTCASFSACEGKDEKGRKYTGKNDGTIPCELAGCTAAKCCKVAEAATCFPGDVDVLVKDGSSVHMSELGSGMAVWGRGTFEPVLGLLHLQADMQSAAARTT